MSDTQMSDDPLDLSPLDPTRDPQFELRVRAIVGEAMRTRRRPVTSVIASWALPALVAATVAAVVPVTVLLRPPAQRAPTTAEILGVPSTLVQLVSRTPQPSLEDIAVAVGAGARNGR